MARWMTMAAVMLGSLLAACDSGKKTPAPADRSTAASTTAARAAASTEGGGRNIASVDVCSLMPDNALAQLLGSKVTQPGRRQDFGSTTQGCEYVLGRAERGAGEGQFEYVFVYIHSPTMFGSLDDTLATGKGLRQQITGQVISGVGDRAFAIDNKTERSTSLHVLRSGDIALEVKANSVDHARMIAEAVLQRLPVR